MKTNIKSNKTRQEFSRTQLVTIYEALEERHECLKTFGAESRNERKQVVRLMGRVDALLSV